MSSVVMPNKERLRDHLIQLQKEGKRIVFTNGCFDLLHLGHATYLREAKALGDVLVVGVNSDASVQNNKGIKRPIVSENSRAGLVAALKPVDFVVLFEALTPIELIEYLKPDIHVKGGDYEADLLPETPIVRSYGGQVVILPFLKGYSTTSIIERCRLS